jgi:hypothetical protein
VASRANYSIDDLSLDDDNIAIPQDVHSPLNSTNHGVADVGLLHGNMECIEKTNPKFPNYGIA